jgi:hypothetical protein
MRHDAHKQPDPRLNGVHSSSACPPIATVMADVAALTLYASSGLMHRTRIRGDLWRLEAIGRQGLLGRG